MVKPDGGIVKGMPSGRETLPDGTVVSKSELPPIVDDQDNVSIHSHETYIDNYGGGNYGNVSLVTAPGIEDPDRYFGIKR